MARVQVRAGLGRGTDQIEHDLDVAEGETFALTGPDRSSRGLLRRIAGLDGSKADILFDGRSVTDVPPERRNVSMVFPSGALYAHLSVTDNVSFGLRARGASAIEVQQRVTEAADAMRIEHLLRRNLTALSASERARVALARALARHPTVLLLDDPLVGVSGAERQELRTDLLRALRRMKVTTLLATPDVADAVALAHHVAYLEGGLLQQLGTPLELYDRPAARAIATRIGSPPMQLVTLPVQDGLIRFGKTPLPVPPAESIVLGVRPEALTLEPISRDSRPMFGTMLFSEIDGARAFCEMQLGEQRALMVCDSRRQPPVGTEVIVFLDVTQLRLFTADDAGVAIPWNFVAAVEAMETKPTLDTYLSREPEPPPPPPPPSVGESSWPVEAPTATVLPSDTRPAEPEAVPPDTQPSPPAPEAATTAPGKPAEATEDHAAPAAA